MKKNSLKMVCGGLVLLMFTSISCAGKGPDKGAKGNKANGAVVEGKDKGQGQHTPNVSVNVTQINTIEKK